MYNGCLILSQILDFVPRRKFNQCVTRYNENYKVQTFSRRDQLIAIMFAQRTGRESLRDIEACLRVMDKMKNKTGKTAESTAG
jgi:hypothetical protein